MKPEAQAGFLPTILAETAEALVRRTGERAGWELRAARARTPPSFELALRSADGVAVIAEVKRRSPAAGAIREDADALELARRFADAGAAAVSVLTEARHFGGSLDDLARVAAQLPQPVLRKDFVLDPLQLYEARALGAAAVLLIVRALAPEKLAELTALAHQIGLASVVEVHEPAELAAALALRPAPTAIGINARDLDTLAVDRSLVLGLLPAIPPGTLAVAESMVRTRGDVVAAGDAGADAVLVGTAVSGAADPAAAVSGLTGAARRGRGGTREALGPGGPGLPGGPGAAERAVGEGPG